MHNLLLPPSLRKQEFWEKMSHYNFSDLGHFLSAPPIAATDYSLAYDCAVAN